MLLAVEHLQLESKIPNMSRGSMGTPGPELTNPSDEAQMPPQERYESCNNKYNDFIFPI